MGCPPPRPLSILVVSLTHLNKIGAPPHVKIWHFPTHKKANIVSGGFVLDKNSGLKLDTLEGCQDMVNIKINLFTKRFFKNALCHKLLFWTASNCSRRTPWNDWWNNRGMHPHLLSTHGPIILRMLKRASPFRKEKEFSLDLYGFDASILVLKHPWNRAFGSSLWRGCKTC